MKTEVLETENISVSDEVDNSADTQTTKKDHV